MDNEYTLFGRYTVEIGKGGKVTVKSKAQYNKPLKVYGKKKDGLRFVNLRDLDGVAEAYDLEAIKDTVLNGVTLLPLTKEQMLDANKYEDLPEIIQDIALIEALPITKDKFGNTQHYHDTENYNVYYQRVNYTNLSNGFEKFHYNVVMSNKWNSYTVTRKTKVFSNEDKVIFSDVTKISDYELDSIFKTINDERIKRKLEKFHKDFANVKNFSTSNTIDYQIKQQDLIGWGSWYGE